MSVFTSQASVSSASFIAKCCLAVSTSAAAVSRTNENFGLFIVPILRDGLALLKSQFVRERWLQFQTAANSDTSVGKLTSLRCALARACVRHEEFFPPNAARFASARSPIAASTRLHDTDDRLRPARRRAWLPHQLAALRAICGDCPTACETFCCAPATRARAKSKMVDVLSD